MVQKFFSEIWYDYSEKLPALSDVGKCLLIAISLLLIGYFILRTVSEGSGSNKQIYVECLGILIMIIGGVFLLPLLAWGEIIGYIFLVIILLCVAINKILSLLKKFL